MKLLSIILITFFIVACSDPQAGTHCANNTNISGLVIDSITKKPISNVHIIENIKTDLDGKFYIPRLVELSITTVRGTLWGCDRSFTVKKEGYTPQLCVCSMNHNDTHAIIELIPDNIKVKQKWIKVGPYISCIKIPDTKIKNK